MNASLLTNPRVWLALGALLTLGAVVAGGTTAFFSSQTAATGNSFTAGTLELQMTQNEGGNSPQSSLAGQWDFDGMAPGGTPESQSVWLRNVGTVPGATLNLGITNSWTNPSNIAAQMRLTELSLDGQNLLTGGAGATIPDYEGPTSCDWEVNYGANDFTTIGDAVAGATAGNVICVGPGNYSDSWEPANPIVVDEEVTVVSTEGPDQTDSTGFRVTADNVTLRGFNVSASGNTGIEVNDADGAVVEHNVIENFGGLADTSSKQGVYLVNTASNATVQYNRFDGVYNGPTVKAVYVGHTAGDPNAEDITISNNVIRNVESANGGGYGVLVNHAGASSNVTVENNTFENVTGVWVSVVGLEGDTPNAVVTGNDFSGLNGTTYPANAVHFEDNPSTGSVVVNENNFESVSGGVAFHPSLTGAFTVDATNNWWGDFDPSDQIVEINGTIDTSNFAGGPFAGFVNGTDQNGNGYADLADLRADSITGIEPGIDPYDGTNDQEFVLSVQLDGPTTGNSFQGLALEDMDVEFTLGQI